MFLFFIMLLITRVVFYRFTSLRSAQELIDKGESQKAFSHLNKRLKPLEGAKAHAHEFTDLCYLLSCRSVSGTAPSPHCSTVGQRCRCNGSHQTE